MAKITIEELYRGDKYDIMSAVTAKALMLGIDERTEDGRTWIARNIYADSEEECEKKLEGLIREMKAEFGIR